MTTNQPANETFRLQITTRTATAEDVEAMKELILAEGPNPWNHLPPDEVGTHMDRVRSGETIGKLAFEGGKLIGSVTAIIGGLEDFELGRNFECPFANDKQSNARLGYIAEAVVDSRHSGQGIASRLVRETMDELSAHRVSVFYAKRHEENAASAGMMRKVGFDEVATFDDPEVRASGSRRTTVCRYELVM